jgi:hypothetical protein
MKFEHDYTKQTVSVVKTNKPLSELYPIHED